MVAVERGPGILFHSPVRRVLKVVGWILGVVFVLAVVATGVARVIAGRKYSRHWTTHAVSFPIPFPLSAVEIETLRGERLAAGAPAADPLSGVDLEAAALTRAIIARGDTWSRRVWAAMLARSMISAAQTVE